MAVERGVKMRVLAVGDVVGQAGCDFLRQKMPQLKEQYRPDFILVNGENSAEGNGILPFSAKQIFAAQMSLPLATMGCADGRSMR